MGDEDRTHRFAEINERARRAFLDGAAEEWTRANGSDHRPPTSSIGCSCVTRGDPMMSGDVRADHD